MGAKQQRRKFAPEFKDEAIKLVIDSDRPVAEVVRDIGVNEGTLGNWVNVWRSEHAGEEPPLGDQRAGRAGPRLVPSGAREGVR